MRRRTRNRLPEHSHTTTIDSVFQCLDSLHCNAYTWYLRRMQRSRYVHAAHRRYENVYDFPNKKKTIQLSLSDIRPWFGDFLIYLTILQIKFNLILIIFLFLTPNSKCIYFCLLPSFPLFIQATNSNCLASLMNTKLDASIVRFYPDRVLANSRQMSVIEFRIEVCYCVSVAVVDCSASDFSVDGCATSSAFSRNSSQLFRRSFVSASVSSILKIMEQRYFHWESLEMGPPRASRTYLYFVLPSHVSAMRRRVPKNRLSIIWMTKSASSGSLIFTWATPSGWRWK